MLKLLKKFMKRRAEKHEEKHPFAKYENKLIAFAMSEATRLDKITDSSLVHIHTKWGLVEDIGRLDKGNLVIFCDDRKILGPNNQIYHMLLSKPKLMDDGRWEVDVHTLPMGSCPYFYPMDDSMRCIADYMFPKDSYYGDNVWLNNISPNVIIDGKPCIRVYPKYDKLVEFVNAIENAWDAVASAAASKMFGTVNFDSNTLTVSTLRHGVLHSPEN